MFVFHGGGNVCGVKFWALGWPWYQLRFSWLKRQAQSFHCGGNIVYHFCRTFLLEAWLQARVSGLHHSTVAYKVVFCNPFKTNSQLMGVVTSGNSEHNVKKLVDLKFQRNWLEIALLFSFSKWEFDTDICETIWAVEGLPPIILDCDIFHCHGRRFMNKLSI